MDIYSQIIFKGIEKTPSIEILRPIKKYFDAHEWRREIILHDKRGDRERGSEKKKWNP